MGCTMSCTMSCTMVVLWLYCRRAAVAPWTAGWIMSADNIMGANAQALGLDLRDVMTPGSHSQSSGARSRGQTAQPPAGASAGGASGGVGTKATPTSAPMSGFGAATTAMRGVSNAHASGGALKQDSPNLDIDMSSFGGMANNNSSNNGVDNGGLGGGGGQMELSQDFLDWGGWNPGVGDFSVGLVGPNGMTNLGDDAAIRGLMDMQQEWF